MNFKRMRWLLFGTLLLTWTSGAQESPTPSVPAGQSTDLNEAFLATKEKPFEYVPVDPQFWEKVERYRKEGNPVGLVVEGARQSESFDEGTPDSAEGRLVLAQGLASKGLIYAAQTLLTQLAIEKAGTSIAEAALQELSALAIQHHLDTESFENLLTSYEFGPLHPEIESFVAYFRYMYNLRYGFSKWAKVQLEKIRPDSPWDFERRYWQSIGDIARGKIDRAEVTLRSLLENPKTHERIKQWSSLQTARLLFERGQFEPAHEIYRNLGNLGVREKGRLLLEIAWAKYYLKSYDKALGLLHALRAPYFEPSLTPERFILEILIYRDLCHYEAVDDAVRRFRESFRDSFLAIRKRLPLREDRALVSLALLDRDLQEKANLIDHLRRETIELEKYSWNGFRFFRPLLEEYKRRDRTLQRELDLVLEPRTRDIAEFLLDTEEQVQFLDYTSKLDALRIVRAGEDRNYKSESISYLTFDSIFWPVENEFWWDEFDDFKVLISSRCNQTTSPADEKMEREFE